jgi:hypothetical protein
MSFVDFKALVKKVNLKPKGVKEIVLEVSDAGLDGKLDKLSEMIDTKVNVQLESTVVGYHVTVDAHTNKPVIEYTVDERGVVTEVKPTHEQLEADLDLPALEVETKELYKEIDLEVVDDFIMEGMAPRYDDLPYDFESILKRVNKDGESIATIAKELELHPNRLRNIIDTYRKRVAPLAEKWNEWREKQEKEDGQ